MAVPCRLCGTPVVPSKGAEGFQLFRYRFVACATCAPKVRTGASVARKVVARGARALIQQRAPKLVAVLDEAVASVRAEDGDVIEVQVKEVR